MGINWRELFPTKLTLLIFLLYMSLFIGQGIFVTASQEANNSYSYNTVTVVLLTEILKLFVSSGLYCRENSFVSLIHDVRKSSDVLLLYFVPAVFYCLYNNLAFTNLSTFDPTTYYLLLQFRVVITGVLFQIVFKKYLSRLQWASLVLLTIGCMLKQIDFNAFYRDTNDDSEAAALQMVNVTKSIEIQMNAKNTTGIDFSISAVYILIQTVCSCLAGVYNEYLLKDKGADVNIFVQNVFMYIDSIVCNSLFLLVRGELFQAFTTKNLLAICRFNVLIIIINNTAIGVVTSFFLKYMNSILKTFASALELLFTAILCYFLFSIPIYLNTTLSIAVVSFAIYLYSQSPVVNLGKIRSTSKSIKKSSNNSRDTQLLLDRDLEQETV